MIIGVPKEIKNHEGRVGLDPSHIRKLLSCGEKIDAVFVESGAGVLSGFSDESYEKAGARIVGQRGVWDKGDMIIKVKEPMAEEYHFLRPGLVVMAFFHFAGNPILKEVCQERQIISVPYEDLKIEGKSPILREMSIIAGEVAVDKAKYHLLKGSPGSQPISHGVITIIGFGVAGKSAFNKLVNEYTPRKIFVIDRRKDFDWLIRGYMGEYIPLLSTPHNISSALQESDVVIGAAVTPTGAPKLITRNMMRNMKRGSFFIDISIDEGGISETSHSTSHDNPTYTEEGVIHYCVQNIPGIVPERSTPALIQSAFPFVIEQIRKMNA